MIRIVPGRVPLAIAYTVFTVAVTAAPGAWVGRLGIGSNTLDWLHVPLFAGLAWVTLSAIAGPPIWRIVLGGGACLAFAIADELLQTWVPARVPELRDVLADAAGIVLGVALREGVRPAVLAWRGTRA